MSKLSSWLNIHAKLPEVNVIPLAEQVAKAVANEILDKYRAPLLAALDAAQRAGNTLPGTGDTAITALVDSHIAGVTGLPQSVVVLVQNFVEEFNIAGVEGEAQDKLDALITDVKRKVSQAEF